jgi:hypothetical protein
MKGKIKIQEDFDQLPGEFTKFFSKDKSWNICSTPMSFCGGYTSQAN